MKAGVATPDGLRVQNVPTPKPKAAEVLVKVHAASLNRADLASAKAQHGHGVMGVPIGIEWAGEVVEAGTEAQAFKPGDRVMCSGRGGYAEYAVCDIGRVLPLPAAMSFEQGATLPIALITMHDALITHGRLKAGESVLIQGATSGVGLIGLQIAKMRGAKLVVGSSTNEDRRTRLKEFGADMTVDTRDIAWPQAVLNATDGEGLHLTVDMVSGPTVNATIQASAVRGRIVNVGRLGGMMAEFDFDQHASKRIGYIGVTFRTRSVDEVREISRLMRADLEDAVMAGAFQIPIDRVFSLDDAPAAQEYMKSNAHFGKILLIP